MRGKEKKFVFILILLVSCFLPISLYKSFYSYAAQKKAVLNKTELTLEVGDREKLVVSGGSGKIQWFSSKEKIALVNQNGIITAKSVGKTKITAKLNNQILSCLVIVKESQKESSSLIKSVTLSKVNEIEIVFQEKIERTLLPVHFFIQEKENGKLYTIRSLSFSKNRKKAFAVLSVGEYFESGKSYLFRLLEEEAAYTVAASFGEPANIKIEEKNVISLQNEITNPKRLEEINIIITDAAGFDLTEQYRNRLVYQWAASVNSTDYVKLIIKDGIAKVGFREAGDSLSISAELTLYQSDGISKTITSNLAVINAVNSHAVQMIEYSIAAEESKIDWNNPIHYVAIGDEHATVFIRYLDNYGQERIYPEEGTLSLTETDKYYLSLAMDKKGVITAHEIGTAAILVTDTNFQASLSIEVVPRREVSSIQTSLSQVQLSISNLDKLAQQEEQKKDRVYVTYTLLDQYKQPIYQKEEIKITQIEGKEASLLVSLVQQPYTEQELLLQHNFEPISFQIEEENPFSAFAICYKPSEFFVLESEKKKVQIRIEVANQVIVQEIEFVQPSINNGNFAIFGGSVLDGSTQFETYLTEKKEAKGIFRVYATDAQGSKRNIVSDVKFILLNESGEKIYCPGMNNTEDKEWFPDEKGVLQAVFGTSTWGLPTGKYQLKAYIGPNWVQQTKPFYIKIENNRPVVTIDLDSDVVIKARAVSGSGIATGYLEEDPRQHKTGSIQSAVQQAIRLHVSAKSKQVEKKIKAELMELIEKGAFHVIWEEQTGGMKQEGYGVVTSQAQTLKIKVKQITMVDKEGYEWIFEPTAAWNPFLLVQYNTTSELASEEQIGEW